MTLLIEQWKPVVGYEGLYEISNTGRIRGLVAGIMIQQLLRRRGYLTVSLSKNDNRSHCNVHVLVAEAFVAGPPGLTQVIHEDGWRTNNRPSNLVRLTEQEARDRQKTERREYSRLYYHANRERIISLAVPRVEKRKAGQRRYYQQNKEAVQAAVKIYRQENKEKFNANARRKRAESPDFSEKERGWSKSDIQQTLIIVCGGSLAAPSTAPRLLGSRCMPIILT
ncbi:NUMOD4 motif protein [Gemmata obscuriglobus]|uniref:HNH nuclease domain-containing protein n=1 Tax=Gemmata obscuriglobus TaxID=114 RepID=A0A2Z3H0E6_9BACT|nr:NUMOD4 domain-containing protein [Gemmata obscuriglobus]AWM37066.1 hypothetical protein C1280_08545 [Gemmata obscuriglobus]QEG30219.1 NUMOD4 motif protein [Gemmata obscuriglobus]VTS09543.1 hnh endonuclease : HNH endonuclease family protein OS=Enterococcus phage EFRM31 GN=gp11 PE=4 SV=1: NUMOD4: HNH_3 [Gemmata obscuriglobus UQM 2246]